MSDGGTAVDDGEWHHAALVSTPDEGVTLYIDGQVEGTSVGELTGQGGASKPSFAITDAAYLGGADGSPDKVQLTWLSKANVTYAWQRAKGLQSIAP